MSLIIKGMEMPQSCWRCKLKVGFSACGLVTDHKDGGFFYRVHNGNSRPDWCPLVPLSEKHGRLIDADAFEDAFIRYYLEQERSNNLVFAAVEIKQHLADMIGDWPTLIPAEGGPGDGN